MTRGLRLGGDDGKIFTHQFIHQAALAHVGFAYNTDEAGFVSGQFFYLLKVQS